LFFQWLGDFVATAQPWRVRRDGTQDSGIWFPLPILGEENEQYLPGAEGDCGSGGGGILAVALPCGALQQVADAMEFAGWARNRPPSQKRCWCRGGRTRGVAWERRVNAHRITSGKEGQNAKDSHGVWIDL